MAVKVLTPVRGEVNKITKFAMTTATSTTDGFEFTMQKASDEYIVIVATNGGGSAAKLTLKSPANGSYAAAGGDEELSLAANESAQIRIESARFADNKGLVKLIPASTDIKVAVLC